MCLPDLGLLSSLQTSIAPEVVSSRGDSRSANDVNAADVPDDMAPGGPVSKDRSTLSSLSTVVNDQRAACATDPPLTLCPSPFSAIEKAGSRAVPTTHRSKDACDDKENKPKWRKNLSSTRNTIRSSKGDDADIGGKKCFRPYRRSHRDYRNSDRDRNYHDNKYRLSSTYLSHEEADMIECYRQNPLVRF